MASSASARVQKKAPEPDSTAASAKSPAAVRRQARARQRKRTAQRQYGDEFMDMDVEVDAEFDAPVDDQADASAAASTQGAGQLGLPGTAREDAVAPAVGLARLAGDEFGSGPTMPMVPSTWR
jgi:PPE-repeat protein